MLYKGGMAFYGQTAGDWVREGMKIQLDEALRQNPGSKVTVDSLIDDSVVREIEKEGFIDRIYGGK